MNETKSVLRDLEDAIARGTADSRERALWHATDLLLAGRYCEEEIATFGEVISRLADEIEVEARAKLADRLARIEYSPASVIRKLAFDDEIWVAGPVLRESERLDDAALVETASTKSQAHLLAIAERKTLSPAVTDVLATHGDRAVATAVARNHGARFSGAGFLHMVKRAENDSILAEHLGRRLDIPRHLFQQLIAKASDDVGKRLASERPELLGEIESSVANIAGDLQSKFGPGSRNYFVAKRTVTIQHRLGNLHESTIAGYATAHKVDEVTIGLSLLSGLPVDVVDRALFDRNREMLLMLAKALGFSWDTMMALAFLGAREHKITAGELDELERDYARLQTQTSRSVLEFYQSRKNAGKAAVSAHAPRAAAH
ncbi:conserved hypothetical protein [Bradyrhizobium sp. ORS 278]|uniref:DUF2336 domain-containing protein n=1 Tax=Bradyrhizobium sp. (strain ORS 278) TaxID=114615 RepID=UPI0001508836|nr:DUF2336 domain-containing protein [Bradyrhizobium sp. ORS 278]CAL76577.1 conserved hypothetical protein [Bradyrhizobium sp. ORS 278]